jgi:CheY-like chemotaxis protein
MVADSATSGSEALAVMRRSATQNRPYQLAIIDADMTDSAGAALARTIRSDPALARTRLLSMSPVGESAACTARRREDFDGWLTKPVRPSHLHESLPGMLESKMHDAEPSGPEPISRARLVSNAKDEASNLQTILVVDDNQVNLKVAAKQLKRLGYRVDLADSGKAALDALSSPHYPIVLLDCEMPEMDGYATTAEIRRRDGDSRHTIIVAMTAHALEGARRRCLDAGMDEYVAKPVTLQTLAAVLERCAVLAKKMAASESTGHGGAEVA